MILMQMTNMKESGNTNSDHNVDHGVTSTSSVSDDDSSDSLSGKQETTRRKAKSAVKAQEVSERKTKTTKVMTPSKSKTKAKSRQPPSAHQSPRKSKLSARLTNSTNRSITKHNMKD